MSRRLLRSALAAQIAAALLAQSPPATTPRTNHRGLPGDRVLFDRPGDGSLWAAGRGYKMEFRGAAATYVPFFGSSSPRNFPIAFAVADCVVGDAALPLATAGALQQQGTHIEWTHGALVEAWDLTLDGAEQSFVLPARPGRGDLVLRLRVDTELEASVAGGGLQFSCAHGAVAYSQAMVVDAAGRRTDVATRLRGGGIEIAVPAAVLDSAVFPITIDPIVTTTTIANSTYVEHNADCAYDAGTSQWVIAWEDDFSATDHDIGTYKLAFDGSIIAGSFVYIDFTSWSWEQPHVANHNSSDTFLVVATKTAVTNHEVWGRTLIATANATGTPFLITGLGVEAVLPDVGGDPSTSLSNPFLVVWQQFAPSGPGNSNWGTVMGRLVSPAGVPQGNVFQVAPAGQYTLQGTRIAKSCGMEAGLQGWPIVWTPDSLMVQGSFIKTDGTHYNGIYFWYLAPPANMAVHNAAVSSLTDPIAGDRYCMVAWEQDTGSGWYNVFGAVRGLDHFVTPATNVGQMIGGYGLTAEQSPAVDSFGSRFALTYARTPVSIPFQIVGATLDCRTTASGMVLGVVEAMVTFTAGSLTGPDNFNPRICSAHSGGGSEPALPPRYLLTWETNGDVFDATYNAHAPTGGFSVVATGCGGLGIQGAGIPHAGSAIAGSLLGQGADPTFVFLGFPAATPVPLCTGCSIGVNTAALVRTPGPQISFSIPPLGGLSGVALAVQGVAIGSGSCLGQLRLSDTLRVVLQ